MPTVVARHTWVGEWDYWFISGANCAFAVLPEREDDARLVRFDDWNDSAEELPRDRCHGGPRGLLDPTPTVRPSRTRLPGGGTDGRGSPPVIHRRSV
ncbi:hypothetical protein [Streptomyces sp. NPDC002164]|uniref:hypothetical protein n=1 Tax=unclassified Streptomyces TaxID=2593676 RepID=UPI0036A95C2F